MRPTFMGFETATRGLMLNQKALDIVGNNTSNIGVTGYTRQRVDLVSLSVNMRYTRYNQNTSTFAGQGAGVYGVSQIRDSFLDKRFREEYSDVGYYSVTSAILGDLHESLDEITPANISRAMTQFQDAWDELLGKTGTEVTNTSNLLSKATQIVQVFRQMSAKVDNVWNQYEYSLRLDVDNVNSILERIAQLNDSIAAQKFNSMDGAENELYKPLELLDQRNVLLDQLSEYADVYYETDADGRVTVWMGTKDDSNPPVVQGDKAQKMSMQVNSDDPQFKTVRVYWNNTGNDVPFNTGSIRGSLDMLNGRGMDMDGTKGETWTQGIHYYKDKIDTMAQVFVDAFNSVIEMVRPEDDPTNPGEPYDPPRYKTLFGFDNDAYPNAAGIKINEDWEEASDYIIKNILDKSGGGGLDDNSYAAKASQLFEKAFDFGEFNGSFAEYISFYSNTRLNNDKAYADSRLEAVTAISENILNQIQQVSGVSLEEEGVDMLMYKKAYDAMSRVFTTLDEMLDKLINSTGVVGR